MRKPSCHRKGCTRIRSEFSLFLSRRRPPNYDSYPFCSDACLVAHVEEDLSERWRGLQRDSTRNIPRPKLGTILLERRRITANQLNAALDLQKENGAGRLGEWLLRLGYVNEHHVTEALARQCGLPIINLTNSEPKPEAVRMIPARVARHSGILPVGFDDDEGCLRVAVKAPVNFSLNCAIRRMLRREVLSYVGDQSTIERLIDEWYDAEPPGSSELPTFETLPDLLAIGRQILAFGMERRAENIQVELVEDFLWARLDCGRSTHHQFYERKAAGIFDARAADNAEKSMTSLNCDIGAILA